MVTCPKCRYARKAADAGVPDWQCPGCGIAYAKFTDAPPASRVRMQAQSAPLAATIPLGAVFWVLVGLGVVGYVAYGRYAAPKPVEEAGQQIVSSGPRHEGPLLEVSHPAYYGTMESIGPVLRLKSETAAGLAKLSPAPVVMFATSWCPYCAKARSVFAKNGVRYVELDIERDAKAKRFMEEVMGVSGFPTIVIGNRALLGFDEPAILAGLKEL